jgi:transposase InsO family protein
VNELQSKFAVSERRACLVIDQPRQSQRYQPKVSSDEPALLKDILNLVREFPRYGYRLICGKLRQLGWTINPKRVYRIWKKEGLKVPIKKQKKRRMGDSTNASHRQRAEHPNHVWSWDFIFDRTASGKALKWLNIVDEFTRENLCLEVGYGFTSEDVIDQLAHISKERSLPKFIRSDNGPEFIAEKLKNWLANLDVGTLYVAPGSPWENAFAESFNSRFRDEFLALEVFDNLQAAKILTGQWRKNYNEARPHSSLGYVPPSEFARQCSVSVAIAPSTEHCRNNTTNFNQPVLS